MLSTAPSADVAFDSDETPDLSSGPGLVSGWFRSHSGADAASLRSVERNRRAALTGLTSIMAKFVVPVTTIVSVPLTYRYLGMDRYGLWMTMTSFVLFLGFADFGVGNGLASAVSEAHGKDDPQLAQRQISCGFFLLCFLALGIFLLLSIVYPLVPWGRLYGTSSALAGRGGGTGNGDPDRLHRTEHGLLGTVLRVQIGYQQGFVADLWNAGGNALALAGIIFVTRVGGGLPTLVLAVAGAPVLITALNWVVQFLRVRPWLRPQFAFCEREVAGSSQLWVACSLFSNALGFSIT